MITDPARVAAWTHPGNPDVCPVYDFHKIFPAVAGDRTGESGLPNAAIGCNRLQEARGRSRGGDRRPYGEARANLVQHPGRLDEIAEDGRRRATAVSSQTMAAWRP